MHDSQNEHVFTDEFDDLCILISLDMDSASASMEANFSEPNCVWDERVPISLDHLATGAFEKC